MIQNGCVQLEIGSASHVGRVRTNNEDMCAVLPSLKLFIVSDGMGGESHGEVASSIAVNFISAYCSESSAEESMPYQEVPRPDLSEKTNRLANAVRLANDKIYEAALSDPQLRGMGATVVAAWVDAPRLSVVHVGDSRAYLLRSGFLRQLTTDHTLIAEQIKRGLIKPEQAHLSKMQNILIRALGVHDQVELDAEEYQLLENDILLLCTDGLTNMVTASEITSVLLEHPDAQASADYLVSLANQYGGTDNVTLIVVHISGTS
jgi:serine/threonine protein phosphatase PrpC